MDRHRRSTRAGPGSSAGLRTLALLAALVVASCTAPADSATRSAGPSATALPATPSAEPPTPGPIRPTLRPVGSEGPVTAVLVGAGDIAQCGRDPAGQSAAAATAALVKGIAGTVFTAGDDAYETGSAAQFRDCYDPTWGQFRDRTLLPAAGNHDFKTPDGAAYFDYFGTVAGTPGEGWYSRDIGGWHIVVLDSNCEIVGCGEGSAQLDWLQADLAAHPARCTLAIWHHPRFSSGLHENNSAVMPFWSLLAAAHADLVINGHDHDYERFAPQDASGRFDPIDGITEIVVGTGGAKLRPFATVQTNSVASDSLTHGVLVLTLHAASYDWQFVPVAGETYTDSGSAACN